MKICDHSPTMIQKRVISIFSLVLILLISVEVWISTLFGSWGYMNFGWWPLVLGSVLTITGLFLVGWTIYIQLTVGKGTPYPKVPTQSLITTGPYAHTRNPMTLGAFKLYLGIGVGLSSTPVILFVLIIFTALLSFIYKHETLELSERFGEEYLGYRKRTPFFFPKILPREVNEDRAA